jgi:hypothetical protein
MIENRKGCGASLPNPSEPHRTTPDRITAYRTAPCPTTPETAMVAGLGF